MLNVLHPHQIQGPHLGATAVGLNGQLALGDDQHQAVSSAEQRLDLAELAREALLFLLHDAVALEEDLTREHNVEELLLERLLLDAQLAECKLAVQNDELLQGQVKVQVIAMGLFQLCEDGLQAAS